MAHQKRMGMMTAAAATAVERQQRAVHRQTRKQEAEGLTKRTAAKWEPQGAQRAEAGPRWQKQEERYEQEKQRIEH